MSTITDVALKRVTLAFTGGITVTRRMTSDRLEGLKQALESEAAWHELRTEQEVIMVSLRRLAYVELDETGQQVGFG